LFVVGGALVLENPRALTPLGVSAAAAAWYPPSMAWQNGHHGAYSTASVVSVCTFSSPSKARYQIGDLWDQTELAQYQTKLCGGVKQSWSGVKQSSLVKRHRIEWCVSGLDDTGPYR